MALQIWLPLCKDGDYKNQGILGDLTVSTTPTFVNSGKIGPKSMSSGSIYMTAEQTNKVLNNDSFSIAFWIYVNQDAGTSKGTTLFGNANMSPPNNRRFTLYHYSTCNRLHVTWCNYDSSTDIISYVSGADLCPSYIWTHIALTYSKSSGKVLLYKNGTLYATVKTGISLNNPTYAFQTTLMADDSTRYLQDYRVYSNCLTPQEVKEISKGLVAHYTLGSASLASDGNLINELTGGGQCTVSGNSINISGNNSDTYFYIKTTKAMVSGKLYRLSCIGSGFPESALYNFPIAGQSNTGPGQIKIKNGPCMLTFVANDACANAGTNIIMDDTSRTAGAGTISGFCLEEIDSISDSSGYSRNLTVVGNISSAGSVRYDKGIYIPNQNLTSNYLTSGSDWSPSFITTGSISFWCKFNGLGSNGWLPFIGQSGSYYVMAWNNGGNFYHENSGSGTKTIYRDGAVVTAPSDNGNWHHYVITGIDLSSWTNFKINQYGNSWDSNMYISDIRIYNTVLTQQDAKDLYSLGATIS